MKPTNLNYNYDFHTHYDLNLEKNKYSKKGLSGLINLGNKCFMNSILQCLSHTLKLTDYFLSGKYIEDDPEQLNKRKPEYFLIISYFNLLRNLWDTNQLIKPKSFCENVSKHVQKYFNLQQQDSHECLIYILDLLHRGLEYEIEVNIKGDVKTQTDALMKQSLQQWKMFYEKHYSNIIEYFNGLCFNQINCSNNSCEHEENVFEPFNCFSVNLKNSSDTYNVIDCLDEYFKDKEYIDTWKCSKCNETGCYKSTKVWSYPNHVIIHLKRFTNQGQKINHHIDFPLDNLNLTKYVSISKQDPNNYIYTLYAVNYHSGSLDSGHYWSCCKNLDNNWYLFNDGHVSKIHNEQELITKNAYILFYYRKMIKSPLLV